MKIEILVVPGCPNQPLAEERVREALAASGQGGAEVAVRVVTTEAEAERLGFAGSPTILVDGRDPFARPGAAASLACRLYPTPEGLAGAPTAAELCAAFGAGAGRR